MRTAAWSRRATIFLSLCGIGLVASFGACSKTTDTETTVPTTTTGTTSSAGGSGGEGGAPPGLCTDCHGNAQNAAPPLDMNGNSDTSEPTVGAHQSHLGATDWHGPLSCTDCHLLPATTKCPDPDSNHCDGKIDLTFGSLADAHGAMTAYSFNTYTCTGGYCHGSTLADDISGYTSMRSPVFNVVDGSQIACGTGCHTNPPGGPVHPSGGSCEDSGCHSGTVASFDGNATPNTATFVDGSRHIDGTIDFD